ncbi:MAG: HIT family protein [Parcubacteria group bacterium CG10_big_fil_rev_8_21_14_0_10_36_14]|nr:MAG: HIT family protein [Parcubacteria group bacterium CG10_big_fil_rev_8_21_14_0_10_36_14]
MECIFCKITSGELPAEKIYETDRILAFLDIRPTNPGHVLVIPKEHHKNLIDTPDKLLCEIILAIKKIAPATVKATNAGGYNLVVNSESVAGQIIFHTHFHIIPRLIGDGHEIWHGKPYSEGEIENIARKIKENL